MPQIGDLLNQSRWDWDLQSALVFLCTTQKNTITRDDIIPMLFNSRPPLQGKSRIFHLLIHPAMLPQSDGLTNWSFAEQERHIAGIVRRVLKGDHDYDMGLMVVHVWTCAGKGKAGSVEGLKAGVGGVMGELLVELIDMGTEIEYDAISGNWKEWIAFVDQVKAYREERRGASALK